MFNSIRQKIANIISPRKNSISLPNQFLRYGNANQMTPNWEQILMNDRDFYTGYSFAGIRKRANYVARTAIENIHTLASDSMGDDFEHPYLDIIDKSPSFSNYQFWYNISTFLDLEGVFYLMAVRNKGSKIYGDIQYFKLLNPYNITRILSQETLEVGGYTETRNGLIREIPPHMIIEIRELNPFDEKNPFAITDAAKDAQFTLKTGGDFTRHTLRNNINAPGIISTDMILEPEKFKNFKARITGHVKGEPIFANGEGAVTWQSMQTNLKDAALPEVTETNRDELFATLGLSKTIMGIEQSGVTRDTARVQKDLHLESETIPRIQLIIDALNQDYKNHYADEYLKNEAEIFVDNPNATDQEAEIKDTEHKDKKFDLYQKLVDQGFKPELAAQYVKGEIEIDKLGKPTEKPKEDPKQDLVNQEQLIKIIEKVVEKRMQEIQKIVANKETSGTERRGLINQQQGSLQNAVTNIDTAMVAGIIRKVQQKQNNALEDEFADETDVITKQEKKKYINELVLVMTAFYGIMMSLKGGEQMRDRSGEFSMPGQFAFDNLIKSYIRKTAEKASESHINTVADDIYKVAREAAMQGQGIDEIVRTIRNKYNKQIVETRAKTIARTETNRAFTRAQYEADRQFIKQNKLQGKVFKQWRVRGDNPCGFCLALASEGLVPFSQAFRGLGDKIEADGKTLDVNFETIQAGNAHPNCACDYELVIRTDNKLGLDVHNNITQDEVDDILEGIGELL